MKIVALTCCWATFLPSSLIALPAGTLSLPVPVHSTVFPCDIVCFLPSPPEGTLLHQPQLWNKLELSLPFALLGFLLLSLFHQTLPFLSLPPVRPWLWCLWQYEIVAFSLFKITVTWVHHCFFSFYDQNLTHGRSNKTAGVVASLKWLCVSYRCCFWCSPYLTCSGLDPYTSVL